MDETLHAIRGELRRLDAKGASVTLDDEFEPSAGTLVKFEMESAYWHFLPNRFLALLRELPDGAGNDAIRIGIAQKANIVWHGPQPEGTRDP